MQRRTPIVNDEYEDVAKSAQDAQRHRIDLVEERHYVLQYVCSRRACLILRPETRIEIDLIHFDFLFKKMR